ncbi:MAG: DegT/DnrJ/EryC1/StrS family aminotransferase [Sphingomonadales bacterium]
MHLPKTTGTSRRSARGFGMTYSVTPVDGDPNIARIGRPIPVPDVPVEPVLSLASFFKNGPLTLPSVLDVGSALHLPSGRHAIARALEAMGLGAGDKVLLPAFHCASMVEPLAWTDSEPVFYRIQNDLSVDLADITSKIDDHCRVLMVTHYFGFPQDMGKIRDFCDKRGLKLLEDCAHSFFGRIEDQPPGSFGDYAIASPRKFFPMLEGGCLLSSDHPVDSFRLRRRGITETARELLNTIARAAHYRRLWAFAPLIEIVHWIRDRVSRRPVTNSFGVPDLSASIGLIGENSGAPGAFDECGIDIRMSLVSSLIYRTVSKSRIVSRRRENYLTLLDQLSDLPGCRPLLPDLPVGVVPHLFPLWVDDLPRIFPKLEDLAVPMQRFGQFLWPGVDQTICPVSVGLSRHLVQFPCHQEMSAQELRSVIERVRAVIGSASSPAR